MRIIERGLAELVELPDRKELAASLIAAGVEIEQELAHGEAGFSLELSITPNRADLLSHIGLAREVAAAGGQRLLPSKWRLHESGPRIETLARVEVDASEQVRRYVGRVVRNVRVAPSPTWLAGRLAGLGVRPVNNVVDVTNYVMLELGIPLHAFDLGCIAPTNGLPTVRVRLAEQGETLQTLDGQQRTLHATDLVVADASGPLALAGILGGKTSEITAKTVDVFLEAAAFAAPTVRLAGRTHGLRTEASLRFGRGVDVAMVARAAERAAQLLAEVAGGEVAGGALDWWHKQEPSGEILLPLHKVERVLGLRLSPEAVVALLEPLQIRCHRRTEGALIFHVPSFRLDLTRDVDLLEEIARRHGLDNIAPKLPSLSAHAGSGAAAASPLPGASADLATGSEEHPSARRGAASLGRVGSRPRAGLLAAGLSECVHFAFAHAAQEAPFAAVGRTPLALLNPLGEEQRTLRTTLLPGLLLAMQRNVRRGQQNMAAFEVGTVFWQRTAAAQPRAEPGQRQLPATVARQVAAAEATLPHEQVQLACLLTGPRSAGTSWQKQPDCDAHDLLGVWQAICAAYGLGWPTALEPGGAQRAAFVPEASAALHLCPPGERPLRVGQLGQLDPAYVRSFGWQQPVYALEVALAPLEAAPPRVLSGHLPAKFPGTRRDLAIVAPRALPAEAVRAFLAHAARAGLGDSVEVEVQVFDVYAGSNVPSGHVSLAFAILYRSASETLADERISPAFARLLLEVRAKFGVAVRDGSEGPGL